MQFAQVTILVAFFLLLVAEEVAGAVVRLRPSEDLSTPTAAVLSAAKDLSTPTAAVLSAAKEELHTAARVNTMAQRYVDALEKLRISEGVAAQAPSLAAMSRLDSVETWMHHHNATVFAMGSGRADPKARLPVGEGAHQSHKAVEQRTTNSSKDCDEGKWNDCFDKDAGDFQDGHSSGRLKAQVQVTTTAAPKDGARHLAVLDAAPLLLSMVAIGVAIGAAN